MNNDFNKKSNKSLKTYEVKNKENDKVINKENDNNYEYNDSDNSSLSHEDQLEKKKRKKFSQEETKILYDCLNILEKNNKIKMPSKKREIYLLIIPLIDIDSDKVFGFNNHSVTYDSLKNCTEFDNHLDKYVEKKRDFTDNEKRILFKTLEAVLQINNGNSITGEEILRQMHFIIVNNSNDHQEFFESHIDQPSKFRNCQDFSVKLKEAALELKISKSKKIVISSIWLPFFFLLTSSQTLTIIYFSLHLIYFLSISLYSYLHFFRL